MSESRKVAPKVALVATILAVAFIVVLVIASPESQTDADSPLLGNPAPAVVTTTIEDETFDLARRKGSWVVLNFFNSTCVPCRAEHPELLAFADAQAKSAQPAELYTVINDDSDGAVKAYFDEHGGSWPKLRDDNGTIAVAFGVARVPETWIVDPNGFVRLRIAGKLTEGLLDEQLAMLQGQS
ncbi:MAG: TlpA family protein disulfide reductase [Ilumatobacteraceae bacterium]|jgi:cytochrome c biogenesis protein CcmG/thiol:disulfide interchange protein DsbE